MFNSKFFCIIVVLTTLALGAGLYFQIQEMMEYDLLVKLDKQYLSGTFTGKAAEAAPAKETEKEKKAADTAKKDDKK